MRLLKSLNIQAKTLDIAISLGYLVVFLLYYEVIRIPTISSYISSTPPQFIFFPLLLLIGYRFIRKESLDLYLALFSFFFLWTFFVAGNHDQFRNTAFLYSDQKHPARICVWNTAYFFDFDRDLGFKTLKEKNCDIIMLQEVWKSENALPELIAARDTYLPQFDVRNFEEFVLFIPPGSDLSLIKSNSRGFFGATLHIKDEYLTVYNVHLWNPLVPRPLVVDDKVTYIDAEKERVDQINELLSELTASSKKESLVVVSGDFNSMQNHEVIRKINKIGEGKKQLSIISSGIFAQRNTYPASRPFIQIDYSYISQVARPKAKKTEYCVPRASDHCLIVLDVLL
jgi:exonuclease III